MRHAGPIRLPGNRRSSRVMRRGFPFLPSGVPLPARSCAAWSGESLAPLRARLGVRLDMHPLKRGRSRRFLRAHRCVLSRHAPAEAGHAEKRYASTCSRACVRGAITRQRSWGSTQTLRRFNPARRGGADPARFRGSDPHLPFVRCQSRPDRFHRVDRGSPLVVLVFGEATDRDCHSGFGFWASPVCGPRLARRGSAGRGAILPWVLVLLQGLGRCAERCASSWSSGLLLVQKPRGVNPDG
jgi:hypothetical protein